MLKKIVALCLMLVLGAFVTLPVSAAETQSPVLAKSSAPSITPYYIYILQGFSGLELRSNGFAIIQSRVLSKSNLPCSATAYLQRYTYGSWRTIQTNYAGIYDGVADATFTRYVSRGTYRVSSYFYAYDAYGRVIEASIINSPIFSY